jgi:molecular chaperone DnaK (HSP70)
MSKVAVDFGTTNTVVAVWRESISAPQTLVLPGLSLPAAETPAGLIPSLLYILDGEGSTVAAGYSVRAQGYDGQSDERFFASFKRGISARTRPLARLIDESEWDENRAGETFLRAVLEQTLASVDSPVEELVLTVPVHSFESYLKWLRDETSLVRDLAGSRVDRIRIVDESTAAALGYDIRTPGELVLVFDFGGGTLDVSLVRMPLADEGDGLLLRPHTGSDSLTWQGYNQVEARVVAKAGRVLGGEDIDHWLLDELLERNGKARHEIGDMYAQLKMACEAAKVRLSNHESAEVAVIDPDTYQTYRATFTRSQLEDLLDQHEFYQAIQRTINAVLRSARTRGIFAEDVSAVLMIGGSSQIPSVRRLVRSQFGADRVFENKPFEAVAHGALSLALGVGLDDFLYHSYGVRHFNPITLRHEWEEIIPSGTRYPLDQPVELILTASRDGQEAMELVIGEVADSAGSVAEVMFGERAILMVDGAIELKQVIALNDENGSRTVAFLDPPGKAGEDRVKVQFQVDRNRALRVTVYDLLARRVLLADVPVVELH